MCNHRVHTHTNAKKALSPLWKIQKQLWGQNNKSHCCCVSQLLLLLHRWPCDLCCGSVELESSYQVLFTHIYYTALCSCLWSGFHNEKLLLKHWWYEDRNAEAVKFLTVWRTPSLSCPIHQGHKILVHTNVQDCQSDTKLYVHLTQTLIPC